MASIRKRLRSRYLLPLLAISIFSIASFAASVIVTQTTEQAQSGVYFNVIGGFTAASNGFLVVQATGASSAQPCTWANGGTCQTALTAGDWYYSVTLTMNTVLTAGTYTLTVQWNTGAGYSTLGTRTVTVSTITNGQTMTFLIDTAGTTFTAPAGITITVA
ncbi:MAG TPA: hypothetical protein VGR56_06665 [Nitrososphaerales archaeon]|nr:hypothetical protein [Nitrososphaerales archaeon]